MSQMSLRDILPRVHEILRRRHGHIEIITGQGIAKGQRVELTDNAQQIRCVIKTSTGGRISFGHRGDGTWSGLSESDRVVVIAPTELKGDDRMVSMFDQKVLLDAFEANHAAQAKAGMAHMPNWLAPFHEDRGVRGEGGGFGDKAIWTEPLNSSAPVPTPPSVEADVRSLTIAEAKQGLAKTFGVSPDAIEITIRG